MAKKIVDEILKYSVQIDGNEAQKELFDLEKKQRKLEDSAKDLRQEKKRLQRQNKKGTEEWKRVSSELRETNREIRETKSSMTRLRKEIGLTALTPRQLRQEANRLKLALHNMIPGSADAIRYQADLDKVNARLRELRLNGRKAGSSMDRVADKFNQYATLGFSVIATTTGIVLSLQKLIDFNGKLADAQANVSKTTGLSADEVDRLTIALGKFKTRSARIELLAIAEEAGRLGKKAIPEIAEFVRTADMIKVALGDDLQGDINQNVRVIGKLAEQYRIGAEFGASLGESMQMIGSAINEVAASGSNQAGFLVDILKRTSGVANQADIAADKIIGLAAAADEAGQTQEITATALNKTFIDMAQNVETYAQVAGMSVQEFSKLLDEDAYEALLTFLSGLKGNDEGLRVMAQRFNELGVDGVRTVQVLGALSNNIEKVRQRQATANTALNEATSLYEEFLKKNTNFAGVIDHLRKKVYGFIIKNPLTQWLKDGIVFFAKFVGAIDDTDGSVTRLRERIIFFGKALTVATVALLSYKAAMKLAAMWTNRATAGTLLHTVATKAKAAADYLAVTSMGLYIIATNLLTGKIKLATAAQRAWNLVVAANPIGALISVIAAATTAYFLFRQEQEKLSFQQQARLDLQKAAAQATARERAALDKYLLVARDETIAKEKRLEAMRQLRKIAPDYLGDIKLEEINTLKAKKAIDQYIQSLEAKAIAEALQEKRVELLSERVNKLLSDDQDNLGFFQKNVGQHFDKLYTSMWSVLGVQTQESRNTQIAAKNRKEAVAAIDDQIEALNKLQTQLIKSGKVSVSENDDPAVVNPDINPTDQPTGIPEIDSAEQLLQDLIAFQAARERHEEDAAARRKAIIEKYGLDEQSLADQKAAELETIQQYLDAELISLEEHAQLKNAIEDEYLRRAIERAEEEAETSKVAQKEKTQITETMSAFSAAAQARDAESARQAVLNSIRDQIQAYLAKGIAAAISSILGTGPMGLLLAPGVGAAAGALFRNIIPAFNSGLYDVIDQHGQSHRAQRNEAMPTGLYSKPTVSFGKNMLVAEKRPELVIDGAVTQRLMNLRPEVIQVIQQERRAVHGYAQGNYPEASMPQQDFSAILVAAQMIRETFEGIRKNGLPVIADDRFARDLREKQAREEYINSKSKL